MIKSWIELYKRTLWLGFLICVTSLLASCSTYGVISNKPRTLATGKPSYSIKAFNKQVMHGETAVLLTFSGGGTRASALAYGVLAELNRIGVESAAGFSPLLDSVETISAVSGGSFTAAYYGLHGKRIFEDFESRLLRRDGDSALFRRFLNPIRWFSSRGRTEMAVDYFDETVFEGAKFSDMNQPGGPLIVINATDLSHGVRFSFIQEYFDLLCSDLGSYPVARAVMASSGVPVLFNPIVLKNYRNCGDQIPAALKNAKRRQADNAQLALIVDGMTTFYNRDKRPYIHFVDGGITDNLGLRAISDILALTGGAVPYMKTFGRTPPRRVVVISVNAATNPELTIDRTTKQPSLSETVNAMSDIQLQRYNIETIDLFGRKLRQWANEISTGDRSVETYFVQLRLNVDALKERRFFLNQIPTGFSLNDEQVDTLVRAGGELLRENPEFQRLTQALGAKTRSGQ